MLYDGLNKEPTFDRRGEKEIKREQMNTGKNDRRLQEYTKRNGRPIINFFYTNRDGGNIFTPSRLESIRKFEQDIRIMPGFKDVCYSNEQGNCLPFDSIVPYFYPEGTLVNDIDSVLRSFTSSTKALAKMDRYFTKDNLRSNITMTTVWLNYGNADMFLESLHHELWEADASHKYPEIIVSWRNEYMTDLEAQEALQNDALWSLGALCFIATCIYVKVFNIFAVLAGVLGLVLSFTSALYWQNFFEFNGLTALHVAGIFVMLGIGCDDIFMTIDSYKHTEVEYHTQDETSSDSLEESLNGPEIVKKRMISAYKTAGSMLFISSLTTAICFFSNVLSSVIALRDFGSYMGTVVILNYLHVMTILPSALLVNELHIKPLQRKIWAVICSKANRPKTIHTDEERGNEEILAETAITLPPTPVTTLDTDDFVENDNEPQRHPAPPDDYRFLQYTESMGKLDRFFVQIYAPAVFKWRYAITSISVIASVVFAVLAWYTFSMYDGTIIVFKEKYNLGRVQRVVDLYYPEDLVKMYLDEGVEVFGDADVSMSDLQSFPGGVLVTSPTTTSPSGKLNWCGNYILESIVFCY